MRISSASGGVGGASGSRRAIIEKQIRRLEEKKKVLMKKLNQKSGSSGDSAPTATLGQATVRINNQSIAGQGGGGVVAVPAATANDQTASSGTGAVANPPVSMPSVPVDNSLQSVTDNLHALRQALSSGQEGGDGLEFAEDPEDIMKQIQLLDLQIMTLRQQLGDDSMLSLAMMPEDGETSLAELADMVSGAISARTAELPEATVTEGHVDGYA